MATNDQPWLAFIDRRTPIQRQLDEYKEYLREMQRKGEPAKNFNRWADEQEGAC